MGLSEQQAKDKGIEVRIGKFPFAALGRAMAVNETDGFIKVVADKKTHEILGIHIVGPEATDLISEGALALEMHAFLEDIGLTDPPAPDARRGHDGGEPERARPGDPRHEPRSRPLSDGRETEGEPPRRQDAKRKRRFGEETSRPVASSPKKSSLLASWRLGGSPLLRAEHRLEQRVGRSGELRQPVGSALFDRDENELVDPPDDGGGHRLREPG